jgi:hypothetical protein
MGAGGPGADRDLSIETPGTTRPPDFDNVDLDLTKDIRVSPPRHDGIQKTPNLRVIRSGLKYSYQRAADLFLASSISGSPASAFFQRSRNSL